MQTSIVISRLELYGYHGYFEEEQQLGQKFLFDVYAVLVPVQSHLQDNFEASIRYDSVIEEIAKISDNSKFRTLEALGETIARELLRLFDRIYSITVTVTKASPPIARPFERVSVEIQMDRTEGAA